MLGRLIINGEPYDDNVSYINNNLPRYIYNTELSTDYGDITSIINYDLHGSKTNKDYKFIRSQILNLVWTKMSGDPNNWNNLSYSEKEVATRWFVVPKILRDNIYTTEQQIPLAKSFDQKSIECRQERFNNAKYEIYNRLTTEQSNIILNEIEGVSDNFNKNLRLLYIDYGRESITEGDPEGIFDYLLSRTGTSYENNGFTTHVFIPSGYQTMSELSNDIILILNGLKD